VSWIPSSDEIAEEAANYSELTFFKKSKNILASFVIATSLLTLFLLGNIEQMFGSGTIYEIAFNLFLSVFIFLNHRWAMLSFCALYLFNKLIFLFSSFGSPISQIIFGAIALMLTYSAFRVATALRKNGAAVD
jgi:hypothetical protein